MMIIEKTNAETTFIFSLSLSLSLSLSSLRYMFHQCSERSLSKINFAVFLTHPRICCVMVRTHVIVLIHVMVLTRVMVLTPVMVFLFSQCYSVILCYGVILCWVLTRGSHGRTHKEESQSGGGGIKGSLQQLPKIIRFGKSLNSFYTQECFICMIEGCIFTEITDILKTYR